MSTNMTKYGSLFVPHKRKILCRYNDLYVVLTTYYVVITTYDGCRYNEILCRYNDIIGFRNKEMQENDIKLCKYKCHCLFSTRDIS